MALVIQNIGGACPCQADGVWDNQFFYFRARHGEWTLEIGATPEDAVWGELIAEGDDPTGGHMSDKEARAIIEAAYKAKKGG